jgi:hypothetical protein
MSEPKMTLWRSPAGRYHLRQRCSGNGQSRKTVRVSLAVQDAAQALKEGRVCRCAQRWARGFADGEQPRYVARMGTLPAVPAIYDTKSHGWPVIQSGLKVPQSFPTLDDAQAWADEHLNWAAR